MHFNTLWLCCAAWQLLNGSRVTCSCIFSLIHNGGTSELLFSCPYGMMEHSFASLSEADVYYKWCSLQSFIFKNYPFSFPFVSHVFSANCDVIVNDSSDWPWPLQPRPFPGFIGWHFKYPHPDWLEDWRSYWLISHIDHLKFRRFSCFAAGPRKEGGLKNQRFQIKGGKTRTYYFLS